MQSVVKFYFTLAAFLLPLPLHGDEGMWLFNKPPAQQLERDHGFQLQPDWLDHLRLSSVRFGGASASFVSADGLVLTNHHVGRSSIHKLSTPEHDLLKNGFYAATLADEKPCPDVELRVLMAIDDITDEVNGVVTADQSPAEAFAARRRTIAGIEKNAEEKTGLRSDVVTLYRGGAYHLYQYKIYTDVRLVFAPENQIAFFGGDAENFSYPRHCLDFCFFRAYEDDKPAKVEHFLDWSETGPADGDLVFLSGHPGRTNRLNTVAQLHASRDHYLPYRLGKTYQLEVALINWSSRDLENRRRAERTLFGVQNGRKATEARLDGLLDPAFLARRELAEREFRKTLRSDPKLLDAKLAFERIADTEERSLATLHRGSLLAGGDAFDTTLFNIARTLLRAAVETPKPNGERLGEFQDAARPSLERRLFSPSPIYKNLEQVKLASSLASLCTHNGATDPLVRQIMDGKSPRQRAADLVLGTHLEDLELRHKLYDGGQSAIDACDDPMLSLARLIESESRTLRSNYEALGETRKQAHQKIADARFALLGDSIYPDATGSLRLSYGVVKGYRENDKPVPHQTTFDSLYQRCEQQAATPPFHLAKIWDDRNQDLNLDTPLNFVATLDITGGNSGSPVVNRKGQLVGLAFDSNSQGLIHDIGYSDGPGRAVSVHSAGMLEALRKVYRADRVVEELTR